MVASYRIFLSCATAVLAMAGCAQLKDLYQLCEKFDVELQNAADESLDRRMNSLIAMDLLKKDSPLHSSPRGILRESWLAITNQVSDPDVADKAVSVIHECRPFDHDRLAKTLGLDVANYAVRRSSPLVWLEKLEGALKKVSSSAQTDLAMFVSSGFIRDYHINHWHQCLDPVPMSRCTVTDIWDLARSTLLKVYGIKNPSPPTGRDYFVTRERVEKYIEKWLLRPCGKYVDGLGSLMKSMGDFSYYFAHAGINSTFMTDQTEELRESVFRFNFCKGVADQRDVFISDIWSSLSTKSE